MEARGQLCLWLPALHNKALPGCRIAGERVELYSLQEAEEIDHRCQWDNGPIQSSDGGLVECPVCFGKVAAVFLLGGKLLRYSLLRGQGGGSLRLFDVGYHCRASVRRKGNPLLACPCAFAASARPPPLDSNSHTSSKHGGIKGYISA